jgi:uncharacterized protein (DUF427 family)
MAEPVGYPLHPVPENHIEPAPRRVRGLIAGEVVFDTTRARYVWEWPPYPQYYIPLDDVAAEYLVDEHRTQRLSRGSAQRYGLSAAGTSRPAAARVYGEDSLPGLAGLVRFEWDALDAWFEEDEQIFVHPRSPYVRVDAIRSRRHLRVQLDGLLLAESDSPVLLFETGLPTRYYVDRTALKWQHLEASQTQTACPYKGRTTAYFSVRTPTTLHRDLAWCYDFPTVALTPIAGLVCFYNEKVDLELDGVQLARPHTHFS